MAITCAVCATQSSDATRYCPTCGARLAEGRPQPDREVRKTVTVLFCDIVGSTQLGEKLDAESVRSIMGRFFAIARRVLERHGGTVEKFIGDAVMAVFGIPTLHEDDAARAVRAAADLLAAVDELNVSLESERGIRINVRIGVNTGEVIAGDGAAGGTLVTGDAVNVAARLEQLAEAREVLLGESTQRLVRGIAALDPLPPIAVRGKTVPVNAFRLISVSPESGRYPRWLAEHLVGREPQLAQLVRALDEVAESRAAQLLTVVGAAGIGKSRLVAEFVHSVDDRARALRGRCLPYGDGVTYFPLAELVQGAAGIADTDDRATARAKVSAIVPAGARAAEVTSAIESAMGLDRVPVHEEEIFWATRLVLEGLARERPLVVVIEDIHWAEPAFLDLLEYLGDFIADAAVLLLSLARPELFERRPSWARARPNSSTLVLDALEAVAAIELFDQLDGSTAVDPTVRDRILAAAEGNPLYVEEMLGMLVDEGHLVHDGEGWRALASLETIHVPPTIDALLAARIDGLPEGERAVAERASVVGRVFEASAIRELMVPKPSDDVGRSLLALVRKELIRPERAQLSIGDAYKFRHILIRDAAYHALSKVDRAGLHEVFADWLERAAGDRVDEYEEILGFHLEQAHDYRMELGVSDEKTWALASRARTWLARAAQRAEARRDIRAWIALLERALRLTPETDPENIGLALSLCDALGEGGQPARALALAERILSRPDLEPGDLARARLYRMYMRGRLVSMPVAEVRREMAATLRPLLRAGNPRLALDSLEQLAWAYLNAGDTAAAERYIRRTAAAASRWGVGDREAEIILTLAGFGARTGMPVGEAVALCEQAMALPSFPRRDRLQVLDLLAYLKAQLGDFETSRSHLTEAVAEAREMGRVGEVGQLAITRGLVERFARRFDDSADAFRFAYEQETLLAEGLGSMRYFLEARLAQALLDGGHVSEARRYLDQARQRTADTDGWATTILGGTEARLLVAEGRASEALRLAEGVVERARAAGLDRLVILFANTLEDLATCAEAAGATKTAGQAWAEAYAIYEAKGDVVDADRLRSRAVAAPTPYDRMEQTIRAPRLKAPCGEDLSRYQPPRRRS